MADPQYVRAMSVDAAVAALASADDALVVAGGTVVCTLFNQRLAAPSVLVDISRISELREIRAAPDGSLVLGALATHEEVLRSPAVRKAAPLLSEVAAEISCARLRNRGTVGGSVCTIGGQGDPATVLIALAGRLRLRGPKGSREVALEDFYPDQFAVGLNPGEIVESVTVPPSSPRTGAAFCKLAPRKAMDFTQITVAVTLTCSPPGLIEQIRIGMNGVGTTPMRPRATEAVLRQQGPVVDWSMVASALEGEISAVDDLVYSQAHKLRLAAVALKRAVQNARARGAMEGAS